MGIENEIFDLAALIDNSDTYINSLLAEATAVRKKQIEARSEKNNIYSILVKAGQKELDDFKKSTLTHVKKIGEKI